MSSTPDLPLSQSVRRDATGPPAPPSLVGAGVTVVLLVLTPLFFLVAEAAAVGWSTLKPLIFRQLTLTLIWNTVRLTAAVTVACAILGVAVAWCVERTDLPFRRAFAVVLVLPLAVTEIQL